MALLLSCSIHFFHLLVYHTHPSANKGIFDFQRSFVENLKNSFPFSVGFPRKQDSFSIFANFLWTIYTIFFRRPFFPGDVHPFGLSAYPGNGGFSLSLENFTHEGEVFRL